MHHNSNVSITQTLTKNYLKLVQTIKTWFVYNYCEVQLRIILVIWVEVGTLPWGFHEKRQKDFPFFSSAKQVQYFHFVPKSFRWCGLLNCIVPFSTCTLFRSLPHAVSCSWSHPTCAPKAWPRHQKHKWQAQLVSNKHTRMHNAETQLTSTQATSHKSAQCRRTIDNHYWNVLELPPRRSADSGRAAWTDCNCGLSASFPSRSI